MEKKLIVWYHTQTIKTITINSFWALINYGKNYGTIETNYGTIPNTIELSFTMGKTWHYGNNYGTMEKTVALS